MHNELDAMVNKVGLVRLLFILAEISRAKTHLSKDWAAAAAALEKLAWRLRKL
jgi:hypothetical protein